MVLKKQTVWLLTMLTLMVVLSAYYLFNGDPTEYEPMAGMEEENLADKEWESTVADLESDLSTVGLEDGMNFFLSYKIEREAMREQQIEEYSKMMSSSEASTQAIAQAKAQMDQLYEVAEAEATLETLIKAEGYKEAVVIAGQEGVDVVVKSENALERKQVLDIIHLVRDKLNVAGIQVQVSYR